MATKFQIKRTSVSGRTPNTADPANTSYVAAGELAVNLTDEKLFSSNGTVAFEVGANLSNISVAGNAALGRIVANGSLGVANQALFANSTGGLYWDTVSVGATGISVEQVNSTSNVLTLTAVTNLQFDENSGFSLINVAANVAKVQYTLTTTPTFDTVTVGNSTVNTAINSTAIAVTQVVANSSTGTPGQVLTSNGTGVYWSYKPTQDITLSTFTGNGSNTQFKLTTNVEPERTLVFINGIIQRPTTDYTITDGTLTFTNSAPLQDDIIQVRVIGFENLGDAEYITDDYLGNGSNTIFTLSTSQSSNNYSFVFLNGIAQVPGTDYNISGSTITFTAAPPNNEKIRVTSLNFYDDLVTTVYTANGTGTVYGLPHNTSTKRVFVSLNGLTQAPVTDFNVSANTLTFTNPPTLNDTIIIRSYALADDSAGANTTIQYNKSGVLAGSLGLVFDETTNNVTVGNTLVTPNLRITASNPPANSTAAGTTGALTWDTSYIYVAVGTNNWKKVPITVDGVVGSAVTAGSNTEIQFNSSGLLGANANFTYDSTATLLTVGNSTVNTTVNSSAITATTIYANGAFGSNGQVLTSNGTAMYWGTGGGGAGSGVGITRQSFTGNGSNTNFTLSAEPVNEDHLMVYVDRVLQRDADYSFSGTTLTFAVAPDNAAEIDAYIMTSATQAVRGVTRNAFTGNGSNTVFTLAASSSNSVYTLVFVDTVFQPISEYTISGTTITFNTAPDNAVPIEVVQLGVGVVGDPQVAGSNNEIQYHSSNSFAANNKFTFNPSTTTLAVGSNLTINTSAIFIGNSTVNTTIIAGNVDLQGTQLRVGNVVVNGNQLVLGNVTITDTQISIGNSTVNTVIGQTGSLSGNGAQLTSVNAIALQGNSVNDILFAANTAANTLASAAFTNAASRADSAYTNAASYADTKAATAYSNATSYADTKAATAYSNATSYADTVAATAFTNAASRADAAYTNAASYADTKAGQAFTNAASRADSAYSNATSFAANADNISSGTLNTARLPTTVNVATRINVGANVNVNTTTVFLGNSTVNTSITAGGITINGASIQSISSGDAAQAYSNAVSYADTKAGQAYTNAVAYAASNSYVNSTFLPLAGGTMTGNLVVNASANIVSNLAANNVTFRGDVQIDGNLVVSGTSITLNAASLAVEDNMIYLNNGSQVSHPDLGFAGNYNDGSYKHAGFFRDATDGVWKVFDGYTPEPDASAYIDTSNNTFRIANFTANVITANSFAGNGASITSVDAATVGGNTAATLRSYSDTVAATAFSNAAARADSAYSNAIAYSGNAALAFANAAARADAAYSNATTYSSNADNISSGTLNTARLPATVNVATRINVGANVNINTSTVFIGNSTVNTNISSGSITINGVSVNNIITSNNVGTFGNTTINGFVNVTTNTATFGTAAYVVANGNVGIGTTLPSSPLHISSTTDQGITLNVTDNTWNYIGFSWSGTRRAYLGLNGSGFLEFGSDSTSYPIVFIGADVRPGADNSQNLGTGSFRWANINTVNCTVSGTLTESSSITIKENIDPITDALSFVTKLSGVTYDRKDGSAKKRAGLIAEDVEQILPNVVQKDEQGNPLGIQYTNLIAYLVESIKELKAEIEELKRK